MLWWEGNCMGYRKWNNIYIFHCGKNYGQTVKNNFMYSTVKHKRKHNSYTSWSASPPPPSSTIIFSSCGRITLGLYSMAETSETIVNFVGNSHIQSLIHLIHIICVFVKRLFSHNSNQIKPQHFFCLKSSSIQICF